mmetsp:Transcript_6909/g.8958  ORF Transcript_6909/g.8958 Transcript_6909/m.8958 type:complete len:285 (+) Transcript_6909:57-911(+)
MKVPALILVFANVLHFGLAFSPVVLLSKRVPTSVKVKRDQEVVDEKNIAPPTTTQRNEDGTWIEESVNNSPEGVGRRNLLINVATAGLLATTGVASWELYKMEVYTPSGFVRLPTTQFIAALGDPSATSGTSALDWGLWRADPGPRGVFLSKYQTDLAQRDNVAPMGWKFDSNDWWIEEHGIIMESPSFPVSPGRYLVTGGREVTTGLTINSDGSWKLDDNAVLGDVTHLPCRSARYQPTSEQASSPVNANPRDFPVKPGAIMPSIPGTQKQDYAVLFLIGKAA